MEEYTPKDEISSAGETVSPNPEQTTPVTESTAVSDVPSEEGDTAAEPENTATPEDTAEPDNTATPEDAAEPDNTAVEPEKTSPYPPEKEGGEYDDKGRYIFPDGSFYDIFGCYHPASIPVKDEATQAYKWEPINNPAGEPIYEPVVVDKKKKHSAFKTTLIVMGCIFAAALVLLVFVLIFNLFDSYPDAMDDKISVNVTVSDKGPTAVEDGLASAELIEQVKHSVVVITNQKADGSMGLGSGFIITEDGYIVTNQHVIEGAQSLTVDLYDGNFYEAEIVGASERDDLAVLKINADNLPAITLGKSEYCYAGERVYAIGSPDSYDFAWTVTMGIISHTDRQIKIYDDDGNLEKTMNVIQTDTAVNHGNSGGPLINTRGEVVGIVTLKLSNTTGMGFAIPMDGALEIIEALIEKGDASDVDSSISTPRPMIGITCVAVSADTYCEMKDDRYEIVDEAYAKTHPDTCFYAAVGGIYVVSIDERCNAVGVLEIGDIIISLDGAAVHSNSQLSYYLNNHKPGDQIELKIYRDGEYKTVKLTLAEEIKG